MSWRVLVQLNQVLILCITSIFLIVLLYPLYCIQTEMKPCTSLWNPFTILIYCETCDERQLYRRNMTWHFYTFISPKKDHLSYLRLFVGPWGGITSPRSQVSQFFASFSLFIKNDLIMLIIAILCVCVCVCAMLHVCIILREESVYHMA